MLPLKPIRFYGSALPRPRIHDDVKHSDSRVDPPVGVNDSLLRWAASAHWSMGGTSFKRHRMQGKIEGRLRKLRDEREEGESSDDEPPAPKKVVKSRKIFKPSLLMKLATGRSGDKENSPPAKRRLTKDSPKSPLAAKNSRLSQVTPVLGSRVSPRNQGIETPSNDGVSPPPSYTAVAFSPEFPVIRRRPGESALQASEESDSDVNFEEFSRLKDRPLRRSSRVTAIRRSFKDMVPLNTQ